MKNTRKKVQTKKVPKAVLGALIGTGMSLVTGLISNAKQKKEEEEAALRASQNALNIARQEDSIRLNDYKIEGDGQVDFYQAKGGKITDPEKKKTERPVNDAEAKANSYKENPDSMFTEEGIKMLGFVDETTNTPRSKVEYGKYKGLGYFKETVQEDGRVIISPTKQNIRNASDYKKTMKYLQELNPSVQLDSNYIDTKNRLAKGGNISKSYKTTGGELKPISSDMELAKGNKHGETTIDGTSGIKLMDKTGKPFVEIEDEETIKDGVKVYSDQTIYAKGKTYAQTAEALAKKKGTLEKGMNKGTSLNASTSKRKIEVLDKEEDALFAHQEATKTKARTSVMEEGGWLKKGAEAIVPYLDNVTNAILTSKSPKVPEPVLQIPTSLKTKVNVNPQLNEVTKAVESTADFIQGNTSNSASARNAITKARLEGSAQKANIKANKENAETQLYNANVQNAQQITARNLNTINDTSAKKFARANDIQSRVSANIANLAGDFVDKKNFDAEQAYNKERLDIARQYDTNGTSLRADLLNPTEVQKLKTDDNYFNEQLERYKDNPKELERLKALRGII